MISSTINPVGPSGTTHGKHDVKDLTLNVSKTGTEFRQRHLRSPVIMEQFRHGPAFPALILISQDCFCCWDVLAIRQRRLRSVVSTRGVFGTIELSHTGGSGKSLAVLLPLNDIGQQPCSPFMVICCSWVFCI